MGGDAGSRSPSIRGGEGSDTGVSDLATVDAWTPKPDRDRGLNTYQSCTLGNGTASLTEGPNGLGGGLGGIVGEGAGCQSGYLYNF